MALQTDDRVHRDALISTARIASSLLAKLSDLNIPKSQYQVPTYVDSLIPSLDLSIPHDILEPLTTLHISDGLRQSISARLDQCIGQLQQQYGSAYRQACLETIRATNSFEELGTISRTYQTLVQRQLLPSIRSHVSFILAEVAQRQTGAFTTKHIFKNEFTPVLEKYFEFNGYPSVLHRSVLAEKSGMTPRQIEVWFQNHRKRSKQDGKVVQRLDSDIPLKRALSVLPKNSQPYQLRLLTPSDDGMSGDNMSHKIDIQRRKLASCLEETKDTHEDDLFRPPHAYPETRGSQYDDPFPNDNGVFRFPPPIWRRKPATTQIIPTEVDMDGFARTFHMKLNFVNGPWKRESTPSKSDFPSFTPWFAPSRTIPTRAPHPSLVRTYVSSLIESSIMGPLTLNPHIFDFGVQPNKPGISCVVRLPCGPPPSDSSIIESFTLPSQVPRRGVSPLPQSTPCGPSLNTNFLAPPGEVPRRKVAPLPRRAPSKTQSFGSRTSSFSSESSSSSDDTISSPSTPPSLPNQTLVSVESNDSIYNFDNYIFDFSSLTSNPSPRTFDFSEEKSPYDEQSSTPFQDFTPLVTC